QHGQRIQPGAAPAAQNEAENVLHTLHPYSKFRRWKGEGPGSHWFIDCPDWTLFAPVRQEESKNYFTDHEPLPEDFFEGIGGRHRPANRPVPCNRSGRRRG